jgi:radical SAM protein with 4Fe4S-binding SPASM domain
MRIETMAGSFHIQWHITNLCNLRCRHCYQEDFSRNRDLNWTGLQEIFQNVLSTLQIWNRKASIHLTGGEPLLKPELFLLLDDLNRNPWVEELGLITNGLLLDNRAIEKFCSFPKLKKLKISLDGARPEINDTIRQKGVFQKVMETLDRIQRQGRFEIILMFTVMKSNYQDLRSYVDLCQSLGVNGMILERFIPCGKGKEIVNEVLDKGQWTEVVETLLEFVSMKPGKNSPLPFQAFQMSFKNGETELLGAPCVIGTDGLCIMPEGSVYPCRRFPVPIGNLLNHPLDTLWEKSELLEVLRCKKALKGKCSICEFGDCRGCRSLALALTGDYLAEDPHCCYLS